MSLAVLSAANASSVGLHPVGLSLALAAFLAVAAAALSLGLRRRRTFSDAQNTDWFRFCAGTLAITMCSSFLLGSR